MNIMIIQYGHNFNLNLIPISLNDHLWTNLIAVMIIPWYWLSKRILKLVIDKDIVRKMHIPEPKIFKDIDLK